MAEPTPIMDDAVRLLNADPLLRAARTTCKRGHDLTTPDAFRIDKAGRRFCLLCAQAKERARGPRGSDYWKRINEKRRGKSGRSE